MGQYYCPVTITEDGKTTSWSLQQKKFSATRDYSVYNGLKLTEHSYIRNPFCEFISNMIYHNKMRVGWVGDYSDKEDSDRGRRNALENGISEYYKLAYEGKADEQDKDFEPLAKHFGYKNKFLVNHTKKLALCFNNLASFDGGYIFYPLALLTAIGNGKGGGDYWGTDEPLIGTWAFDLVSIEDNLPDGYSEICPEFTE